MNNAGWPTCWGKVVEAFVLQAVSHANPVTSITQERWLFFAAFRSLAHPWSGHISGSTALNQNTSTIQ